MVEPNWRLTSLNSGYSGIISGIDTDEGDRIRKFMMMGIMPGVKIRVIRSHPGYIIGAGNTRVALDSDLAGFILLKEVKKG